MFAILTIIGLFECPRFTLGCVLISYDHNVLGVVCFIWSLMIWYAKD